MMDLTNEEKWLQEWVNDPACDGTNDLEKRSFTAFEVEMIMHVYAYDRVEESKTSTIKTN